MKTYRVAYHFLRADFTAGSGNEKPWEIGEERTVEGPIELCTSGYHSSPTLWDALSYAPGLLACLVEISEPIAKDETKQVSQSRKLVKAVNIERDLRLFAVDCAERVLHLFEHKCPNDDRPRKAIQAARDFANGKIDAAARAAAGAAAGDAAWAAARAAAGDAARAAARAAAGDAARDAARAAAGAAAWAAARAAAGAAAWAAAWAAETKWQKEHFEQMFGGLFA
jgi:immunity protein 5 of polymorphic toxin system